MTIFIAIAAIYVIGYLIAVPYLAYDLASDTFTVGDLGISLLVAIIWPILVIEWLAKRFPIMTMNVSDIVLWRRKGGGK